MSYSLDNDEGLGLQLTTLASVAGGLLARDKDPGRLSTNAKAYTAAINGTSFSADGFNDPMEFLLAKSPKSVGGQGGWATTTAQNDAWAKYQAAQKILRGETSTPRPTGTQNNPLSLGNGGGPVVAGMSIGPLMMAAIAAGGIYYLTKRR